MGTLSLHDDNMTIPQKHVILSSFLLSFSLTVPLTSISIHALTVLTLVTPFISNSSSLSVIHTPPNITALLSVYLPSRFDLSSLMLKQVTTESFSFSREGLIMMFNTGNNDTIKDIIKAVMAMVSEKWKRKTS